MADRQFISLDNPAFEGRLKAYESRPSTFAKRPQPQTNRSLDQVSLPARVSLPQASPEVRQSVPAPQPVPVVTQEPEPVPQMPVAVQPPKKSNRKRKKPLQYKALPTLAILLFLIGLGVSLSVLRANNRATATVHALSNENKKDGDEQPDETDPGDISTYRVAPDMPRIIRVNSINLSSRVKRVGVTAKNQLKAPGNIYDVGWYEGSNKPGDPGGAALFDAHVSGPTRPGAFKNITKLTAGDKIEVERGDGTKLAYKVVKSQVFDKDKVDMASALVSVTPGKPGLNLMTCTGPLKGNDYEQRIIVYAVQI